MGRRRLTRTASRTVLLNGGVVATLVALQCGRSSSAAVSPVDECTDPAAAPAVSAPALFAESFADGCFAARGWYDNTTALVTNGEHAPASTRAGLFHFAPGATTPDHGAAMRHKFAPSSSVYLHYRVKYSAGWVGSGKPYHPHEFYILSNRDGDYDGLSDNWMTLYVEQNYQQGGVPRLTMQDSKAINTGMGALPLSLLGLTDDRSTGGCNGVPETNIVSECYNAPPWTNNKQLRGPVTFQPSPGPGYISDWNLVEAYFQLNTVTNGVANSDGVMQYWFNGTLVIDRHDLVFRTAKYADLMLNQLVIAPYIGDGSPKDQSMYVDDLIVGTARTGTARAQSQ